MSLNDQPPMINSYASDTGKLTIHYKHGKLFSANTIDKIEWDALKHHIEFYEEDINKDKFQLIE